MPRTGRVTQIHVGSVFALSPIYWLPWVSWGDMALVKLLLLAALIASAAIRPGAWRPTLPPLAPEVTLLLTTLCLLSSLVSNELAPLALLPAILFFTLGRVAPFDFASAAYGGAIAFTVFPALVIVDFMAAGIWPNPIYPQFTVAATGFHGGRTGWAFAVNLLAAVLVNRALRRPSTLCLAALVTYGASLAVVGSIGGVLTFFSMLTYLGLCTWRNGVGKAIIMASGLVLIVLAVIVYVPEIALESRAFDLMFADRAVEIDITNGRADLNEYAWRMFGEAPLWGHGTLATTNYGFKGDAIHNVWLRLLAERGLFLMMAYAAFVYVYIRRLPATLLFAALIPTMFEPTAIAGNYYSTGPLWMLAGFYSRQCDSTKLVR